MNPYDKMPSLALNFIIRIFLWDECAVCLGAEEMLEAKCTSFRENLGDFAVLLFSDRLFFRKDYLTIIVRRNLAISVFSLGLF